jgi:hypothetical protein
MKYRTFDDYLGQRWEVWETNPALVERRSQERRSLPDRRSFRRGEPARRSDDDRRAAASTRFPGLPELERGWLCFERDGQRKRLAPIPEAWEQADDMTLAALCNFATEDLRRW